ncbi:MULTISPECIES: YigZ family protein [unclassified Imperialibacter]|uniref:IMPACT family protein n=1 Tax=unclassified Imperialibacter TaxID=2629706 RepID=UPI00125982A5|nr:MULTISPECIES: YigZ family protein [unclassified Imperialibacter]CAD5266936.1 YigZ family protein [Imperialibacter sp. 75]CAD5297083.1 YigZ family protein [Imperialibacter sp. 89]VVT27261.1 YigZ family protein [Imperialibacter sp. EC-SDR9]
MASFQSIKATSEGFYKEKGSKFLAFAFPVRTEDDIKHRLDELRKQYYDARHHCYAYILGNKSDKYRANDDGEPNHSAGDPILGQIRSKDLTNTLVVVVRYFGGTKLGVSGLIAAYKTAAKEALDAAEVIETTIKDEVLIDFTYEQTSDVMRLAKEFGLEIEGQTFQEMCSLRGFIEVGTGEPLKEKLALAGVSSVRIIKAT